MELLNPQERVHSPEPWDSCMCACGSRATPPGFEHLTQVSPVEARMLWVPSAVKGREGQLWTLQGVNLCPSSRADAHRLGVLQPPSCRLRAKQQIAKVPAQQKSISVWCVWCMHTCHWDQYGFLTSPGDFAAGTGLRTHAFSTTVFLMW